MKRRSNGRRADGEARTHEILERIANELVSVRKEISSMRQELNSRIDATNEHIDHLVEILAPKMKNLDDRVSRLEARS